MTESLKSKKYFRPEPSEYRKVHYWVKKSFGIADRCENDECVYPRHTRFRRLLKPPKRFEWANISGKYLYVREDWKMLCPSCHRTLDADRWPVPWNKGKKVAPPKICFTCKEPFYADRSKRRFCSNKCSRAYTSQFIGPETRRKVGEATRLRYKKLRALLPDQSNKTN